MEIEGYSVGSLSDLIAGSNTPNKPKVIKRRVSAPVKVVQDSSSVEKSNTGNTPNQKKNKRKSKTAFDEEKHEQKVESPVQSGKKQKFNEESRKKSKNEENAERRIKKKDKIEKPPRNPEELTRTVFVGNIPISVNKIQLKRFFMKYGKVETARLRGVPLANPKTPKKVAAIKKEFHPDRHSVYGYVKFETREDAVKATEANGVTLKDHHLIVKLDDDKVSPDESKALFVGNLSFDAEVEDLWKIFEPCGKISSIRIVRDGRTGMSKGFGYINFESSDSVQLALEMEDLKLKDRPLRISLCNLNAAKKNKKGNKLKTITKPGKPKAVKKVRTNDDLIANTKEPVIKNKSFQGSKFVEKKKKNKINKGLLQKKKMVKMLAPKV